MAAATVLPTQTNLNLSNTLSALGGAIKESGALSPTGTTPPTGGINSAASQQAYDVTKLARQIVNSVNRNELQKFYPPGPDTDKLLAGYADCLAKLPGLWKMGIETILQLAYLCLYDLIILIDDSPSMFLATGEDRVLALRSALKNITEVYHAVVPAGTHPIRVHYVNERDHPEGHVTLKIGQEGLTKDNVDELVDAIPWSGLSRFGAALRDHVLEPYVYAGSKKVEAKKLRKIGTMKRPLMVMVVTDGEVEGEQPSVLPQVINRVKQAAAINPNINSKKAVTYQFARVGSDPKARQYLQKLDNQKAIGTVIDTHPNLDLARIKGMTDPDATMEHKENIIKLMIGALYEKYDEIDTRTKEEKEADGEVDPVLDEDKGDGDEPDYEDDLGDDWE